MADEFVRKNVMPTNDFARLEKLVLLDLKNYPYQISERLIGKYKREDLANYLLVPEIINNQLQLRYMSRYLYNTSNHYKRLVHYFANLLTLDFILEPYGIADITKIDNKKMAKAYFKVANMVESMNLKHEFKKVLVTAFREDVFYGYVHQNKDSFFLQRLNPDFCRISSVEDGVLNFAFDFTYFNAYPNRLYMFPQEFIDKWHEYKQDGLRWKELDSTRTICIKVNEDLDYPLPPFVGLFSNILDIQDFRDLEKQKIEIGNYKLLVQEIPIKENSENTNDYLLTLDVVQKFHDNISASLPDQIGLITSPMKVHLEDFERDKPDINKVADAEASFWSTAGVSKLLFAAQTTGSGGSVSLGSSINTDEEIGFTVLRQLERWVNRYIKNFQGASYKFRVSFLDTTIFNRDDVFNRFLQAAQFGVPVKSHIVASMGMNPTTLSYMGILENDVLQLHENMIPLASSHTMGADGTPQTAANQGGRPKKKAADLSDEGAKTRDADKNNASRPQK